MISTDQTTPTSVSIFATRRKNGLFLRTACRQGCQHMNEIRQYGSLRYLSSKSLTENKMGARIVDWINLLDVRPHKDIYHHSWENQHLSPWQTKTSTLCPESDTFSHELDISGSRRAVSKPRSLSIKGEQFLCNKKTGVEKYVSQTSSMKRNADKLAKEANNAVKLRPPIKPEDPGLRTSHMKCEITTSAAFIFPAVCFWLRTAYTVSQLDTLSRETGQHFGGDAYTYTSLWCPSSEQTTQHGPTWAFTPFAAEEEKFGIVEFLRKRIGVQQPENVDQATSATYRRPKNNMFKEEYITAGKEALSPDSLPFIIPEKLEKRTAKLLSPVKIIETFPAMYNVDERHSKPAAGALGETTGRSSARTDSIHLPALHITQLIQEKHVVRGSKERQTVEKPHSFGIYKETALKAMMSDVHRRNIQALSTNNKLSKSPDTVEPPKQNCRTSRYFVPPLKKAPLCPLFVPSQTSISADIGPVANGMNPRYSFNNKHVPKYSKALPGLLRKKITCKNRLSTVSPSKANTSQEKKINFLSISKPLKLNRKESNAPSKKQHHNKEIDHAEQTQPFAHVQMPKTIVQEPMDVYGMRFLLPLSYVSERNTSLHPVLRYH
ncbi:hypothetical protein GN956_G14018 [Arapaima gigas]